LSKRRARLLRRLRIRIETPPVSWLGGLSGWSLWQRKWDPGSSAAFPSFARNRGLLRFFASDSGARWKSPPYSRAAATVFHRLPVRGVSGDCVRRGENSRRAAS